MPLKKHSPGCCCGGLACGNCTSTPVDMEVTIAGVGGPVGACDTAWCDEWNGVHVATQFDPNPYSPSCQGGSSYACNWCKRWIFPGDSILSGVNAFFSLTHFNVRLNSRARGGVTYAWFQQYLFLLPANCSSWTDIAIPFAASTLCCNTLPTEVTVTAI
jgi:hypothetical protein